MRSTGTLGAARHWMDDDSPVARRFGELYRLVQTAYMEARARATSDAEQRKWRHRSDGLVGFLDALDPHDLVTMIDALAVLEAEFLSVRDVISSQVAARLR